ncbi:MAG: repeat-containing protein YrrB [Candidatus Parcubacteria bacterium]|jgi:tetratricopeptide (TPR) repeat protein
MKHHGKSAEHPPFFNYPFVPEIVRNWPAILILTILILIAYVNGWGSEFVSDDVAGILKNQNIDNLSVIFAKPLVSFRPMLYMLLYKIGGADPILFRTPNILFHWGTTLLVYALIKRMTNKPTALMAASLYAVHPILVESVTWISAGSYTQYTFFIMLSLWLFMRAELNKKYYIYSIIAFIFATLNSEKAAIFPLILTVYLLSQEKLKKTWRQLIPYYAITCLWAIWYIMEIRQRIVIQQTVYYQQKGFDNPLIQLPAAISSYLELLFWPDKLSIYHSELAYTPIEFAIRVSVTALFFIAIFIAYKKNKYIFFWLSFFVVSLIPTLLPLRIAWVVAERYVYAGTAGIMAVIAYLLYKLKPRIGDVAMYSILGLLLIGMTARTMIRNLAWANEQSLYLATGRTAPSDFKTHNNLGWVYQEQGDMQRSIQEFRRAVTLNPRYVEGHNNLALAYLTAGNYPQALLFFQKTIELNPNYAPAYGSMGVIYIKQNQLDEAAKYMKKSIELDPGNTPSYHNLGKIYEMQGKNDEAIAMYNKVLEIQPNTWQTQMNLGSIYYTLKDYKKAESYTKKAQALNPGNVNLYISLAKIYIQLGRPDAARAAIEEALKLDPQNKEALEMLK